MKFTSLHREAKEIFFETHIWENTRDFARGTIEDHVVTPTQRGEYVKGAAGGLVAAGDIAFNTGDALVAGLTGERLERLRADVNRTPRDVGLVVSHTAKAVGNLLTLHPIRAVGHTIGGVVSATRTPGSVVMDAVDIGGGYKQHRPGGINYSQAA